MTIDWPISFGNPESLLPLYGVFPCETTPKHMLQDVLVVKSLDPHIVCALLIWMFVYTFAENRD